MNLNYGEQKRKQILKGFDIEEDLEKAYTEGTYSDSLQNKKLGRVGEKYSVKKESLPPKKPYRGESFKQQEVRLKLKKEGKKTWTNNHILYVQESDGHWEPVKYNVDINKFKSNMPDLKHHFINIGEGGQMKFNNYNTGPTRGRGRRIIKPSQTLKGTYPFKVNWSRVTRVHNPYGISVTTPGGIEFIAFEDLHKEQEKWRTK